MVECRFCSIQAGNTEEKENTPIWESDNYFSLASIGAFVPGWVLVIPKMHVVSMKDFYCDNEFRDFVNSALRDIEIKYNSPVIAFEHGANKCDSATSCGVNHAHMHLVPYQKSLLEGMARSKALSWQNCTANQISSVAGNGEYLFYTELKNHHTWNDPEGFIHLLEEPQSQYFRKLMASQLDCIDEYDYKKHPRIELAIKTQKELLEVLSFAV